MDGHATNRVIHAQFARINLLTCSDRSARFPCSDESLRARLAPLNCQSSSNPSTCSCWTRPWLPNRPGFDDGWVSFDRTSAVHFCSPSWHITNKFFSPFPRSVHHLGSYPQAAPGGLRADPAIHPRRACLHLSCSKAAFIGSALQPLFRAVHDTLWRAAGFPAHLPERWRVSGFRS